MEELEKQVIAWAQERNIAKKENSYKQLLKSFEEMGETSRALLKEDFEGLKDGIGDVIVTLIILAHINGLDLKTCLEQAYNEIKNRKGKTVEGVFIKE